MEKKLNKTNMLKQSKAKQKQKQNKKTKLGFLGSGLCTQEQAYVRMQDYAYASSCPETLKTQPSLKH